ncbi:hypothetical protein [Chlamydia vaughanii]|uniref:hypothetical protein n=1 Tax=Chlamydia vaughanii TaxID=3112552 RepID=UPI0032B13BE9
MFLKTHDNGMDFYADTAHHHKLLKDAYVRGIGSLEDPIKRITVNGESLKSNLLSSLPILGTIRGLACLYSIWGVKDRSRDTHASLAIHTTVGTIEALGLGVILIPIKIIITVILALAQLICSSKKKFGKASPAELKMRFQHVLRDRSIY